MSQNEKQRKASPFILKTVMFGQEEETIGEAIPENVFADSVMNHIGTVLGAGQGGKGGAGLWFTGSKKIRKVQENAKIALACMTDPQIAAFCQENGLVDVDDLLVKVLALPLVEV